MRKLVHLLSFALSTILSYLLTPLVLSVAKARGFVDRPNPRRLGDPKVRLVGAAIYFAMVATILVTSFIIEGRTNEESVKLLAVLLGTTVMAVMGAWDDKRELGAVTQLLVQLFAASIAVASGVVIDRINNPFGTSLQDSLIYFPPPVAIGLTVVWIVGVINTINFIDGIDGLAAGVTAVAATVLAVHSLQLGQYTIAVLPLALAGATAGFLPHNFYPSKITMGTTGSAVLGYAIGTLSILGGTKAATTLLVLAVPLIDAGWIIVSRIVSGGSPFVGDRRHLHYRLLDMGVSPRQIVLIIYLLSALLGATALLLSSRLLKLYSLIGIGVVVLGVLIVLAMMAVRERGKLR
ncbi:MAG: undecaprenyl/decaprenyl-phosphate alpha-N-acetylglucosaminyl 1-phosphate transferase [Dehalococcoidia bacterium]|nr:undecaprenyl/decaprenyl-phosphate alpha-N-acetylglucosaminyl 1-phosphate transferase [Dehalococcoidia bacterium]